jgi:hypothetical protein
MSSMFVRCTGLVKGTTTSLILDGERAPSAQQHSTARRHGERLRDAPRKPPRPLPDESHTANKPGTGRRTYGIS